MILSETHEIVCGWKVNRIKAAVCAVRGHDYEEYTCRRCGQHAAGGPQ